MGITGLVDIEEGAADGSLPIKDDTREFRGPDAGFEGTGGAVD